MKDKEKTLLLSILEAVTKLPPDKQYYILGYAQAMTEQRA